MPKLAGKALVGALRECNFRMDARIKSGHDDCEFSSDLIHKHWPRALQNGKPGKAEPG